MLYCIENYTKLNIFSFVYFYWRSLNKLIFCLYMKMYKLEENNTTIVCNSLSLLGSPDPSDIC